MHFLAFDINVKSIKYRVVEKTHLFPSTVNLFDTNPELYSERFNHWPADETDVVDCLVVVVVDITAVEKISSISSFPLLLKSPSSILCGDGSLNDTLRRPFLFLDAIIFFTFRLGRECLRDGFLSGVAQAVGN